MLLNLPAPPVPAHEDAEAAAPVPRLEVAAMPAANTYAHVFDPAFCSCNPVSFSQSAPLDGKIVAIVPVHSEIIVQTEDAEATPETPDVPMGANAPLPEPRPAFTPPSSPAPIHAPSRRLAELRPKASGVSAPEDHRSFFEKLFGLAPSPRPALAYAAPESTFVNPRRPVSGITPHYDRFTAVYDVAAHTVYMPDGTRLEAHSGLGNLLDDPRHVNEHNRGATPPNVYELEPREQLFHGVQALRLKPVGGGDVYGRTGLLAHTYMLGPNGDSNGCVSFRNYRAFLQAYQNGEIKHLVVVARAS